MPGIIALRRTGSTMQREGKSLDELFPYLLGMAVTDGETPPEAPEQDDAPVARREWPSYALPLDLEC